MPSSDVKAPVASAPPAPVEPAEPAAPTSSDPVADLLMIDNGIPQIESQVALRQAALDEAQKVLAQVRNLRRLALEKVTREDRIADFLSQGGVV